MAAMPELKVGIGFSGEAVIVAILEYATACRETMSQANRDRLDAANIQAIEDWQSFWRGITK